ncbi:MAG: hypothetical protein EXR77_07815 [Myxococcales bacterium]|nr:hypothetical protein [Myxococcales bacterium]
MTIGYALPILASCAIGCVATGNDTIADSACSAQLKWAGGDKGSAFMNPGMDCVDCHTRMGEGPKFVFAGTVFAKFSEADLCHGKSGIGVEISGADGKITKATTNDSGNFYLQGKAGSIALPYTAKVTYGGKERKMVGPQANTNCNSCHTATGTSGAPGRIVVPE